MSAGLTTKPQKAVVGFILRLPKIVVCILVKPCQPLAVSYGLNTGSAASWLAAVLRGGVHFAVFSRCAPENPLGAHRS